MVFFTTYLLCLHDVLLFLIPWSLEVPSQSIPSWPCLSPFQSVLQSSLVLPSFFVVYIFPLFSFIRFTYNFSCYAWLSSSLLDFPNQITHSIYHKFLDIVPLDFHILTFTFHCTEWSILSLSILLILSWFYLLKPYDFLQSRADLRNQYVVAKANIRSSRCFTSM